MIHAHCSALLLIAFLCGCSGRLTGATVLGLVTADSVIIASPCALSGEDMRIQSNYDGVFVLGETSRLSIFHDERENMLVAMCGEHSECDFVIAELEAVCDQHLESYELSLTCDSVIQYYRQTITAGLKRHHLCKMDALIGGKDLCRIDIRFCVYYRSLHYLLSEPHEILFY